MISGLDHVAIPVADMQGMLAFYGGLGFDVDDELAPHLYAVSCANQKINFHAPRLWQSTTFTLRGPAAQPGCGDLCFVWGDTQATLNDVLKKVDADVIEGPVERVGGRRVAADGQAVNGRGSSTYVRDPDGNLVEFIIY